MSGALTVGDLRGALAVVRELHEVGPDPQGWMTGLTSLGRLVGCEIIASTRLAAGTGETLAVVADPPQQSHEEMRDSCHQSQRYHPALMAYRSGRLPFGSSVALSDFGEVRAFRRTSHYADLYRPRGIVDDLLCVVRLDHEQHNVLVLSRTRDGFSERDRELVGLIGPHVAQSLAWQQRIASPEPPTAALHRLTAREQQVSTYIRRGATDREIARALAISPRTVHKHLEHIYRKLGLTNRTGLVAFLSAHANGTKSTNFR